MSWFLGFFKQLKEEGKTKSDDVKRELLKYIKLNKRKLRCTMIKIFKVNKFKNNTKRDSRTEIIRQLEMEQIK